MFGFDERYAMFDITPVENQFILEYLPAAKGDYVKVFLYGLMCCYHPEEDMTPERMSRELNMTVDEVAAAFRYWERRRLVRRISDNPPKWQYINIKQKDLSGGEPEDPEYEEFSDAVYEAFGKTRRLHGSELNTCFEWREDLKLPTEVIIMLLNHMVEKKGKNFRMAEAEKVAVRMAEEDIRTVDAAEEYFSRDEKVYAAVREILNKMGKRYQPSEAQIGMYLKWTKEWHFTPAAVLEAVKLTGKKDPSMGYLDGILRGIRQENPTDTVIKPEQVIHSAQRSEAMRTVFNELRGVEFTPLNGEKYDQMRALYPQEIVLIAARECGNSQKGLEDTLDLLKSWKEKGFETSAQVNEYVRTFHSQTELIHELRKTWGTDTSRAGKTDRGFVSKWQDEMGFSREVILLAAPLASEAKAPMAYLDKILKSYLENGIITPEQAENELKLRRTAGGKPAGGVAAQQYVQRDYSGTQDELIARQDQEMEAFMRRKNGGKPDA